MYPHNPSLHCRPRPSIPCVPFLCAPVIGLLETVVQGTRKRLYMYMYGIVCIKVGEKKSPLGRRNRTGARVQAALGRHFTTDWHFKSAQTGDSKNGGDPSTLKDAPKEKRLCDCQILVGPAELSLVDLPREDTPDFLLAPHRFELVEAWEVANHIPTNHQANSILGGQRGGNKLSCITVSSSRVWRAKSCLRRPTCSRWTTLLCQSPND